MPISSYRHGFPYGVNIQENPIVITTGGDTFWVHHSGSDGPANAKGTFKKTFASIDYAIGRCAANHGDIIRVKAGHAETITTAGAIAADVAGVTVLGEGYGSDRPEITFNSSDNSASILITAVNFVMRNIVGICSDDGLTNPIHVQAAGCIIDIEWQDGSATVEAATVVLGTAAADNLIVNLKYFGFTAGDACVSPIILVGSSRARIHVDFYGKASTAVVEFKTTAVVDVTVTGYMYNDGVTDYSKSVVDTVTGSTWAASFFDGAAGNMVSGGSGDALAAGDLSAISGQQKVREAAGDADIDISEDDYTGYINILTVTAPANGLADCVIDIDLNKATTGWDNVSTAADTLDMVAVKQIDGTNYRSTQLASAQIVANGDGTLDAAESGITFRIGPMQANASVQIHVKLSVERGDTELPYRVTSVGDAPTITPVATI